MPARTKPTLCYVTDRKAPGAGDLLALIRRAIACGLDAVQIREKDLLARPLLELARGAVAAAQATATRILVNDRLDVALAAEAAGIHLGEESLPLAAVDRWRRTASKGSTPAGFLVGVSRHSLARAVEAERAGADYIFFGPVFTTPSKAAYGPPRGIERLAEVCRSVSIPVLAIGGVTLESAPACLAAGAAGIAAIRMFQEAPDLSAVVTRLRSLAQPAPPERT